jgi:hypothetical protein
MENVLRSGDEVLEVDVMGIVLGENCIIGVNGFSIVCIRKGSKVW